MSATAPREVPLEAAQALAQRLRDHPEDAHIPPAKLARQFGLSPEFVREFLEGLAEPNEPPSLRPVLNPFIRAFQALRRLFRRLTSEPLRFVGITTIISIAAYLMIDAFFIAEPGAGSGIARRGGAIAVSIEGNNAIFLAFAFSTLILHLACYFRHGMVRYSLFGGLISWMISAPTLMVLVWNQLPDRGTASTLSRVRDDALALIGIAVGMLFLNIIYACAGMIASVAGGAWRIRQKDRERDKLPRQELLERMFDIQERLQSTDGAALRRQERAWEKWGDLFDRNPYAIALAAGLAHALLEVTLFGVLLNRFVGTGRMPPLIALVNLAVGALWLMLLVAIGFFTSRTLKAILTSWLFILASLLPLLIPVGRYGTEAFIRGLQPASLSMQLGIALVIASIAAAGGRVEQRAVRDRRLTENDPATLLAELVKLQWQLSPQTSDVCVICIDAASSAEMKAQADPWAVEYSFREYQSFLEQLVHEQGGSVLSTAGDGAVAEFPEVASAYRAARSIQTNIDSFNRRISKLEKPFRLRIGMHLGPVAGCINDVEFSAVIDIASHVQDAAPVGGIALTQPVAEALPGEALARLAEEVDNYQVFLSMRPTLDA